MDIEEWDECPRGDWMLMAHRPTPEQAIEIAARAAERVLHIYEGYYPDDDRPRRAIEAARSGCADAVRTAYYGVFEAARQASPRAADAAYAAESAVKCAYARWSVCADYALQDAVNAALYADLQQEEHQKQADDIREIVGNPYAEGE